MMTNISYCATLLVAFLVGAPCFAQPVVKRLPATTELGSKLQSTLTAFHQGAAANKERLRVVYFHAGDTPPQADFQARLQRIMLDVQQFYLQEMRANGFEPQPLPLEINDGKLTIHMVKGAGDASTYTYESGRQIRREAEAALRGKVDFAHDFVMVFCGLCQRKPDGSYFFHSPYYGDGSSNHLRGLCYAADCEKLDTRNFTKTDEKFRYLEHNGRHSRTLAAFNSLYIGGIAHELGHGLSLPHNGQLAEQRKRLGTALMGSGNYTYRNQLWRGGNGSYMTMASALRLAAHPLFTGSDRGRQTPAEASFEGLKFKRSGNSIQVSGSIKAKVPVAGVIAYADPAGGGDYDAFTTVAAVEDGKFQLEAKDHRPGSSELRLTAVLANGAVHTAKFGYTADKNRVPDIQQILVQTELLPIQRLIHRGKSQQALAAAAKLLKDSPNHPAAPQLKHLPRIFNPPALVNLAVVQQDTFAISDSRPATARTGWGSPRRNHFSLRSGSGSVFLSVNGAFHAKGLYAHAPSNYAFATKGKWKRFTATVGLQDGGHGQAVFTVIGDGKVLYKSKPLKAGQHDDISLDITGVNQLELVAGSAVRGNSGCWSVWASPVVSR